MAFLSNISFIIGQRMITESHDNQMIGGIHVNIQLDHMGLHSVVQAK